MSDTDTDVELDRPRAPVVWRFSTSEVSVRFGERIVEHVVIPYDFDAVIEWPKDSGRMLIESVAPGAFDGVERRANRVRCNRDHDFTRTVGRALALHPSRTEGLVAEAKISKTPLGDETLELLDDGVLEASAGMASLPSWVELRDNRSRRRVNKAFLDHIAYCPNPAYEGGVPVLDMRGASAALQYSSPVETPNLDEVLAWMRGEH